ncbi:MAG: hypothetical protein AMXMBFR7_43030 [Planctomycetota bacterium]
MKAAMGALILLLACHALAGEAETPVEGSVKAKELNTEVTSEDKKIVAKPLPDLTAEQKKAVETALKDLEHEEFAVREAASKRILDAGPGAIVILEAALQAHGGDPERTIRMKRLIGQLSTAKFVGPDADWPKCLIQLRDVHPLHGGVDIDLQGDGACLIRIVGLPPKRRETKTSLQLTQEQAQAFRTLCIQNDLIGLKIPVRPGMPGEGRPSIVLKNAAGQTFQISKWSSDKEPRFDDLGKALYAIAKETIVKEKIAMEKSEQKTDLKARP